MYQLLLGILALLIFQNPIEQHISVFGYTDELLGLLFFPLLLRKIKRDGKASVLKKEYVIPAAMLLGVILLGFAGNVIHGYQPLSNAVKDAYVNIKFYLVMGVGFLLFEEADHKKTEEKLYPWICGITAVLFALCIADIIFEIYPAGERWGVRAIRLFYNAETSFAAQGMLLCALYLKFYEQKKEKILPWLLMSCFMVFSTLRFKAIIGVVAAAVLFVIVCKKQIVLTRKMGIVLTAVIVVLAAPQVLFYVVGGIQDHYARPILIVASLYFGIHYFPFGTGWGTFASHFSVEPYSPVYGMYQMAGVWGLSESDPRYVSDNFWPMILGQCGIFALILYLIIVWKMLKKVLSLGNTNVYAYASGLLIMIYLLLCSTGESAFAGPAAISAAFFMGYLFSDPVPKAAQIPIPEAEEKGEGR